MKMPRGKMKTDELTHLSAVELARLIRTKKAGPFEVTQAHLEAIEKLNPAVNAFCTVAAEKAPVWAREAEAAMKKRARLGALHGVPVAIKDPRPPRESAPPGARPCSATTCPPRT